MWLAIEHFFPFFGCYWTLVSIKWIKFHFQGLLLFALISVCSAQIFKSFGVKSITTTKPFIKSYPGTVKYYSSSDNDGQYHPDDSGAYSPDGSGGYVHSDDPYKHLTGPNGGGSDYTGGFGPGYKDISK